MSANAAAPSEGNAVAPSKENSERANNNNNRRGRRDNSDDDTPSGARKARAPKRERDRSNCGRRRRGRSSSSSSSSDDSRTHRRRSRHQRRRRSRSRSSSSDSYSSSASSQSSDDQRRRRSGRNSNSRSANRRRRNYSSSSSSSSSDDSISSYESRKDGNNNRRAADADDTGRRTDRNAPSLAVAEKSRQADTHAKRKAKTGAAAFTTTATKSDQQKKGSGQQQKQQPYNAPAPAPQSSKRSANASDAVPSTQRNPRHQSVEGPKPNSVPDDPLPDHPLVTGVVPLLPINWSRFVDSLYAAANADNNASCRDDVAADEAIGETALQQHPITTEAQQPTPQSHFNYLWQDERFVPYERLTDQMHRDYGAAKLTRDVVAGTMLEVYAPNNREPSEFVPVSRMLNTRGGRFAFEGTLGVPTRVPTHARPSHCAHFYFNQECTRGVGCAFIHVMAIDGRQKAPCLRAPGFHSRVAILAGGDPCTASAATLPPPGTILRDAPTTAAPDNKGSPPADTSCATGLCDASVAAALRGKDPRQVAPQLIVDALLDFLYCEVLPHAQRAYTKAGFVPPPSDIHIPPPPLPTTTTTLSPSSTTDEPCASASLLTNQTACALPTDAKDTCGWYAFARLFNDTVAAVCPDTVNSQAAAEVLKWSATASRYHTSGGGGVPAEVADNDDDDSTTPSSVFVAKESGSKECMTHITDMRYHFPQITSLLIAVVVAAMHPCKNAADAKFVREGVVTIGTKLRDRTPSDLRYRQRLSITTMMIHNAFAEELYTQTLTVALDLRSRCRRPLALEVTAPIVDVLPSSIETVAAVSVDADEPCSLPTVPADEADQRVRNANTHSAYSDNTANATGGPPLATSPAACVREPSVPTALPAITPTVSVPATSSAPPSTRDPSSAPLQSLLDAAVGVGSTAYNNQSSIPPSPAASSSSLPAFNSSNSGGIGSGISIKIGGVAIPSIAVGGPQPTLALRESLIPPSIVKAPPPKPTPQQKPQPTFPTATGTGSTTFAAASTAAVNHDADNATSTRQRQAATGASSATATAPSTTAVKQPSPTLSMRSLGRKAPTNPLPSAIPPPSPPTTSSSSCYGIVLKVPTTTRSSGDPSTPMVAPTAAPPAKTTASAPPSPSSTTAPTPAVSASLSMPSKVVDPQITTTAQTEIDYWLSAAAAAGYPNDLQSYYKQSCERFSSIVSGTMGATSYSSSMPTDPSIGWDVSRLDALYSALVAFNHSIGGAVAAPSADDDAASSPYPYYSSASAHVATNDEEDTTAADNGVLPISMALGDNGILVTPSASPTVVPTMQPPAVAEEQATMIPTPMVIELSPPDAADDDDTAKTDEPASYPTTAAAAVVATTAPSPTYNRQQRITGSAPRAPSKGRGSDDEDDADGVAIATPSDDSDDDDTRGNTLVATSRRSKLQPTEGPKRPLPAGSSEWPIGNLPRPQTPVYKLDEETSLLVDGYGGGARSTNKTLARHLEEANDPMDALIGMELHALYGAASTGQVMGASDSRRYNLVGRLYGQRLPPVINNEIDPRDLAALLASGVLVPNTESRKKRLFYCRIVMSCERHTRTRTIFFLPTLVNRYFATNALTAPAVQRMEAYFIDKLRREVYPDGVLPPPPPMEKAAELSEGSANEATPDGAPTMTTDTTADESLPPSATVPAKDPYEHYLKHSWPFHVALGAEARKYFVVPINGAFYNLTVFPPSFFEYIQTAGIREDRKVATGMAMPPQKYGQKKILDNLQRTKELARQLEAAKHGDDPNDYRIRNVRTHLGDAAHEALCKALGRSKSTAGGSGGGNSRRAGGNDSVGGKKLSLAK